MARVDETIFVRLEDEGTLVWRPVIADRVEGQAYRISASQQIPEDECWQFRPGEIVRCKFQKFQDGSGGQIAVERL